ncbi:MAG: signal peptidase I [Methylotenera sp.]|nr:signal peptidase I [Oligoflexia bacterium]
MTDHKEGSTPGADTQSRKKWFIENVTSLGLALLLVFMIRSSVVEAFKIPSGSMIPTLFIGDHIFVNKFAYGFKIPFSDLVTDHPVYVVKRDPPKRGDIIVFMYPKDESFYYIKRVIGTPGDTVEIRSKVLYVNNQMVPKENLPPAQSDQIFQNLDDPKYSQTNLELFREKMGENNKDHVIMLDKNNFLGETFGPITVPPESLFVMGDNRDFSNDSRFWGFVPMRNVKGRAEIIWLSLWINFSDSQLTFRPSRIGTILK